ncbi:clavesin-2 [Solenopsis invicta]|uniref:clavesin-2 n=1 Tax=Solenopsis invicta TaxID=13686 RepID=UPI00193D393F|nr:clavesin-2 [Solenopsis invicta]XP_011168756.2 clavesin-2 [Solenopsis invicta]XP_039308295.1 clavesin-2 [Solenopsis invicta]
MSEYMYISECEYLPWHSTRNRLDYSTYEERRFEKPDKKLSIKMVRSVLRHMPDVDLEHCTDEYITRFLLARKYNIEQTAALIAAYQAQITLRQDIFGNLTARDPALQRALRAGIPGVLPARDRKGRCVLVILASQWDPVAVPALSVQRAIFLVLEILIQDPRNQQSGFVAVIDWGGFSLRQGGALGTAALRNLIAALRGRFPARFKAIHFLSAPLYVQATLALVKPFLDEKTRNKIFLHGNNLSTLHEHLPTDILPAELGGTGPAFNPGLWAEPVIHSAMKEAELTAAATAKKGKERQVDMQEPTNLRDDSTTASGNHQRSDCSNVSANAGKTSLNNFDEPTKHSFGRATQSDVELNVVNKRSNKQKETMERFMTRNSEDSFKEQLHEQISIGNINETHHVDDNRTDELKNTNDLKLFLDADINLNEFEMIPSRSCSESSKDNLLDNRLEQKALIAICNNETPSEKTNLIT